MSPSSDLIEQPGVSARYARVLEPRTLELMRRGFNQMNKAMVPLWRLGLGRMMNSWPEGSGQLLVLEHVGRRSGTKYRTPVNFAADGEDLYVLAAFGEKTHWFRNILAAPDTAVWLPDGRWVASAEDASDDPRRLELVRRILVNSGFVAPLIGLRPREMSDEALHEATSMYCLLRIRPQHKESAPDGPGDLVWVWPIIGLALAAIALGRRRARS
jgi:deazaflavin-dependent oxidoreductase (nitroreductase family)